MMDFVQNLVAISLLMFKIIESLRKSSFIIAMTSKIFVYIFGKLISCKRQINFINYKYHHIIIRTGDT